MKSQLSFIAAVACPLLLAAAPEQTSQKPFSLTISLYQGTVRAGADIHLRIAMTNHSTQAVDCSTYAVGSYDRKFRVEIWDQSGKPVALRHTDIDRYPGSLQMCTLKPGESITKESMISWQHDFSHPGKYEIQVSRGASNDWTQPPITSNKITITVLPADPPPPAPK